MSMKIPTLATAFLLLAAQIAGATKAPQPIRGESTYKGWKSQRLANEWIELQVVPDIGGRVIQFKLADKEFFWVNPRLAGKPPTPNGLAPDGTWLNYGGDKLWPAPQGWDNDQQWPGPPDAVLDGQPYVLEKVPGRPGEAALRLTSGKDPRSGIQFSRFLRIFDDSTRVSFEATMKNIDTKPRRWGIWAHTQLDAANADGSSFNPLMNAWCPLNPQSHFPKGFTTIFGATDNPSFQPDAVRGLMRVQYQYKVGKIGLDSDAGWVATVNGASGAVFVQRFVYEPENEYPDGSSVEFWHNGVGTFHAYNKDTVLTADPAGNPYVFESEVLSPFAELQPGQSYTWRYDWFAANIGGDFPIVNCTSIGITAEPLMATISSGEASLKGRFGIFAPGTVRAEFYDARGRSLQTLSLSATVTPLKPLVIDTTVAVPAAAASVGLVLVDGSGRELGELARVDLQGIDATARWPVGRAWDWYDKQPWLVGFNYIPATAINTTEMWQADTFDAKTIDRELALAESVGFNCVRVFLQYLVWESDPDGLKRRMDQFLSIARKHGLRTMWVLFDDCAFSTMTEPFLGRQPDVIPGEYANGWTPSPGPRRVQDRAFWPKLESYVTDLVGRFRDDPRMLMWDVYNEPGNTSMGNNSRPFLEAIFGWARRARPDQPLTAGVWGGTPEITRVCLERSDLISFHNYGKASELESRISEFRTSGRPIICTEWLNRPLGSLAETCLPVLARHRVGGFHWGLVNGKTQTHFPWGSKAGAPEPKVWQHDLFRKDHSPYDVKEIAFFKKAIAKGPCRDVPYGRFNPSSGKEIALAKTKTDAHGKWQPPVPPIVRDWVIVLRREGPSR